MIIEMAQLHIHPGSAEVFETAWREAAPIFARTPNCHGAALYRGVEHPLIYTLLVNWTSVADHDAFRRSADFSRWRQLVGPHFAEPPSVSHIQAVNTP